MAMLIENLEGRMLFSVAATPHAHVAAEHTTKLTVPLRQEAAAPVQFQGQAVDSDGQVIGQVRMTVRKTGGKLHAEFFLTPPGGKPVKVDIKTDATGHFTFDRKEKLSTFHLEGQISTDPASVTGSWTRTNGDGTKQGTFTLSRVDAGGDQVQPTPKPAGDDKGKNPEPKPTPPPAPPPPAPAAALVSKYVGEWTNPTGPASKVLLTVGKVDGVYRGVLQITNPNGGVGTIQVTFDATGKFVYDGGGTNEKLHIEGQTVADTKMIAGTWTLTRGDTPAVGGTFSATRT